MGSGVEGLPSLAGFVTSLAGSEAGDEPAPGSAGAVVALTAALAADLAAQVARQSPDWVERQDALRGAGSIRERAIALAGDVDRTYLRALAGLSRAAAAGDEASSGRELGDALVDIVALLLSIGEAAADAAELARLVAASGSVSVRATVVAAAMLAAGAAEAAAHLVEVNLLVGSDDAAAKRAREYVSAARVSCDAAAALPR